MSVPTIKQFLANDIVDANPATVSASNAACWPTSADVADYGYLSLGSIWVGVPTTSSVLASRIVYKAGEGANNALGEISLISLPTESVENQQGLDNNSVGAIDYYMEIVYRQPDKSANWSKINNAALRVRYLLDHNWRAKRRARPNHIMVTPVVDKSLGVNEGIICRWLGYKTPPNGIEVVELWLVSQQVVVPQ